MPRGDQLSRQWRLLQMIDRPQGVTVDDAARDLEFTIRTIWRDLGVLQAAGFPIYTERAADGNRGVWRVTEEFKRALPLKLTLGELVALLMSRNLLTPLGVSVLGPEVASAFDKIQRTLSRDALKIIEQMRDRLGVRPAGAKLQAPAAEHLPKIHTALAERRTLRTRYYSASRDSEDDRAIDPYHLTLHNGGLYLVGHCHRREAVRIFAVERMRTVELTRLRFEVPADFDAEKYLAGAWGMVQGELVTVRVIFARALAPYIHERLWHPSQKLRELTDGRLEITLLVADTLEVRRWILGYGVLAEVVAPEGLREALRIEAEALTTVLAPRRQRLAIVSRSRSRQRGRDAKADRSTETGSSRSKNAHGQAMATRHTKQEPLVQRGSSQDL
jgi:predicted DNA-binding transcriptional regulator YafY